jgi:putative transcriptional regulator
MSMSAQIKRESRERAKRLHKLGLMDDETYNKIMKLSVREVNPEPILYTNEKLVNVREGVHLSQAAFAKYLHVSKYTLSKWERGERDISPMVYGALRAIEKYGIAAVI